MTDRHRRELVKYAIAELQLVQAELDQLRDTIQRLRTEESQLFKAETKGPPL